MARAYVGVGANLGDRRATVLRAVEALGAHPEVEVVGMSALRETAPWGPVEQPAFLNGAVALETTLAPRALLELLLSTERALGRDREREQRWGPRSIDLDLLLYGACVVDEDGLQVPHPHLHERAFALEPLAELDPTLAIPGRGGVVDALAALHSAP